MHVCMCSVMLVATWPSIWTNIASNPTANHSSWFVSLHVCVSVSLSLCLSVCLCLSMPHSLSLYFSFCLSFCWLLIVFYCISSLPLFFIFCCFCWKMKRCFSKKNKCTLKTKSDSCSSQSGRGLCCNCNDRFKCFSDECCNFRPIYC